MAIWVDGGNPVPLIVTVPPSNPATTLEGATSMTAAVRLPVRGGSFPHALMSNTAQNGRATRTWLMTPPVLTMARRPDDPLPSERGAMVRTYQPEAMSGEDVDGGGGGRGVGARAHADLDAVADARRTGGREAPDLPQPVN